MDRWLKPLILIFAFSSCGGPQGCFPRFVDLKTQYPHVIYKGPGKSFSIEVKKSPPPNWVPLSQISKKAQGAVIVSEDWAFYTHPGYDEKQIREAIEESVEEGKLSRGASTITQQVVKNIYLSNQKSLVRKVREVWMATKLEKVLGKKRILELYLNIAEMGEGIFGVGKAADFYFHKTPAELSGKEGAFLAMLLPSPKKYSISYRQHALTPYARKIVHSILNKMVQAHYLTPEERDAEWAMPLSFEPVFDPTLPEDESQNSDELIQDSESNDQTIDDSPDEEK